MVMIAVHLPEDQAIRLVELAQRMQITPEALAQVTIQNLLAQPDKQFEQAARYVLEKDADLYRRLS